MRLNEEILRMKQMMRISESTSNVPTDEQFEPLIQKGKEIINKFVKKSQGPKKDTVLLLKKKKKRFNRDWVELVRKMRSKEITTTEFLNGIRILKKQYGINDITDFDKKISNLREEEGFEDEEDDLDVKIYANGGGSDNAAEYEGEIISIPVEDTIPNEPFKDLSYMENSKIIKLMIKSINSGDELPPIKVIEHPYDSSKYLVVDGNHRRFAFSKSEKENIDAIVIPHEDILLMKNEWGKEPEESIRLIDVIDDKEMIDKYFIKPDGENKFKQTEKITEQVTDGKTAVIEILGPLAFMNEKYRFQSVPFWKTLEKNIYIKKGSSGNKTISTENIKVLKVFDGDEEDKVQKFLKKLREKESGENWIRCENCNKKYTQTIHKGKKSLAICPHCGTHNQKKEQNEGEITERCWKGYTQKGMKTMFGKRYPNCVKKK